MPLFCVGAFETVSTIGIRCILVAGFKWLRDTILSSWKDQSATKRDDIDVVTAEMKVSWDGGYGVAQENRACWRTVTLEHRQRS